MTLYELIPLWRERLVNEGKSYYTAKSYASRLRNFVRWIETQKLPPTLDHFTEDTLLRYRRSKDVLRPRSVNGDIHALKSFGKWLVAKTLLAVNPTLVMDCRKIDPVIRPLLTEEEVLRLMDASNKVRPKDRNLFRAVVYVLATTGIRRSELLDIHLSHVEFAKKRIKVFRGKGDTTRYVYPSEDTLLYLQLWIEERNKKTDPACQWLFVSSRTRRMAYTRLSTILQEVKEFAGMGENANVVPHAFRHAFATRLHRKNVDIKALQLLLGHSQLKTTDAYLHADEEHLASLAKLSTPSLQAIGDSEKDAPPITWDRDDEDDFHPPEIEKAQKIKPTESVMPARRVTRIQRTPIQPPPTEPKARNGWHEEQRRRLNERR